VEEGSYRQSRLCRLFGNPVAFAVVQLLAENKDLSPSEIARAAGRSVQRVTTVLGALRLAEVVRYETDGKRNLYRLKNLSEVKGVLSALSRFVKAASTVRR
jgi:predicted transcriptional regulator